MKKRMLSLFVAVVFLLPACGSQNGKPTAKQFQAAMEELHNAELSDFFSELESLAALVDGIPVKSLDTDFWHIGSNNPYYTAHFTVAGMDVAAWLTFPKESERIDRVSFFFNDVDDAAWEKIFDAASFVNGPPDLQDKYGAYWNDVMVFFRDEIKMAEVMPVKRESETGE